MSGLKNGCIWLSLWFLQQRYARNDKMIDFCSTFNGESSACGVPVVEKELGVKRALRSEVRKANSGGGVLMVRAANPLPSSKRIWETTVYAPTVGSGRNSGCSTIFLHFEILFCYAKGLYTVPQPGRANRPGGSKIT